MTNGRGQPDTAGRDSSVGSRPRPYVLTGPVLDGGAKTHVSAYEEDRTHDGETWRTYIPERLGDPETVPMDITDPWMAMPLDSAIVLACPDHIDRTVYRFSLLLSGTYASGLSAEDGEYLTDRLVDHLSAALAPYGALVRRLAHHHDNVADPDDDAPGAFPADPADPELHEIEILVACESLDLVEDGETWADLVGYAVETLDLLTEASTDLALES